MADPIDQVISLRADTSKLDADLAAAKAKAEAGTAGADAASKATAATNAQTAATSRLGDELRKVKKTYGEQIEVVQGLIGKIAAIGATVAIAYKTGAAIREYIVSALEDGAERAKDFQASLTSLDTAVRFEATKKQIAEVEGQLAGAMEDAESITVRGSGILTNIYERKIQQLKEQLATLRRDAKIQEDFLKGFGKDPRSVERDKRAKEDDERRKSDAEILDRMEEEARKGRRRIDDEQQKRREAFEDFQAQQAAQVRAQQEAAAKVQQSWTNAYRAIREESNRAFATDQAASMVQLAAQMRLEGTIAAANMNQIIVQGVG